ncbi:beta-1,6-N-acetylglucosaminyltransferase [Curtobacterium sp. 24E2]|nr:hypothetical protein JN350_14570 [Curtobacterium sp. 24E2]
MAITPTPLACIVLAHEDPTHVRRLVAALDPFPVFLHCDASTDDAVFEAMTAGLPERVHVLPRMRTGWAKWENVAAEVAGYRAALAQTDATHVALLTGSDYPLADADEISALLTANPGQSFVEAKPLPHPAWGRDGGRSRVRFRHWAWRKHMLRLPVPVGCRATSCSAAARSSRSWPGTTRRGSSTCSTGAPTWWRSGSGCGSATRPSCRRSC